MESPLHHFHLDPIIPIKLGELDLSINKAILAMWAGMAVVYFLFRAGGKNVGSATPSKLQSVLEISLEFIRGMVEEFIGKEEGKEILFIHRHPVFFHPLLQPDRLDSRFLHHHQSIGGHGSLCHCNFPHDAGYWLHETWRTFFQHSGSAGRSQNHDSLDGSD